MIDVASWIDARRRRTERETTTDDGTGRGDDDGAAVIEFIVLSLLLLVPLVYLVLTLARIQAGAFAAEGAAYEAARTTVVTGVAAREHGATQQAAWAAGSSRAQAAVALLADDFGFEPDAAALELQCDGPCLEPGGNVQARVTVSVPLPGIPGFVGGVIPLSVDVVASARAPVDSVVRDK